MRITYSCGHEGSVRSSEEWKANGDCYDCYRAKKLEAKKVESETALNALKSTGEQLPALTGSEKQIAWAEQIRAKALITTGCGWAVRICMARGADKYLSAKWWIDYGRNRIADDWVALALPADWHEIEAAGFGGPMMQTAAKILRHGVPGFAKLAGPAELIAALSGIAALPASTERPVIDGNKNFGDQYDDIYNWLCASWARTGLIEFYQAKVQQHADKVKDVAAAAVTIATAEEIAKWSADAAEKLRKAEANLAEARRKEALATHLTEQAGAEIAQRCCLVGQRGVEGGRLWIAREILDDGFRIIASNVVTDERREFSQPSWVAMCQVYVASVEAGK